MRRDCIFYGFHDNAYQSQNFHSSNFHPLGAVDRVSEPQLQVGETFSDLSNGDFFF